MPPAMDRMGVVGPKDGLLGRLRKIEPRRFVVRYPVTGEGSETGGKRDWLEVSLTFTPYV